MGIADLRLMIGLNPAEFLAGDVEREIKINELQVR